MQIGIPNGTGCPLFLYGFTTKRAGAKEFDQGNAVKETTWKESAHMEYAKRIELLVAATGKWHRERQAQLGITPRPEAGKGKGATFICEHCEAKTVLGQKQRHYSTKKCKAARKRKHDSESDSDSESNGGAPQRKRRKVRHAHSMI